MTSTMYLDHLDEIEVHLQAAATELQAQWSSAMLLGDFTTLDCIIEASQAVHRALTALQTDRLQPAG